MMFKKSTCKITYIEEISTQILVLPYVGQELNMVILLPSESTDVYTVTRPPWACGLGSRPDPCLALRTRVQSAGRPRPAGRGVWVAANGPQGSCRP